ncbi:MAG: amidase [Hyphomicrobiaceae bacterium]|nr:amidase [Hyphomicrobiaceae bacterium]
MRQVLDPGRLRDHAAAIASGKLSPVALVERYLDRIDNVEPHVLAWRELDGERALREASQLAREAGEGRLRGPLHGIPLGVKDIIDVEGLPTRCNSRSRARAAPATADAEIVLQLKRQGMIVLGKLHTTEFAFFDPSPARNPHNPAHTPGGSSSGSAAAVASGMVPAALGTQTVASVNRPAAYCGIAAFKPSTRSTLTHGIAPLAPSYDTVGFYGYTVDDAVTLYEAAASPFVTRSPVVSNRTLVVLLPEDPHLAAASDEASAAWRRTADLLGAAGHRVRSAPSPVSFEEIFTLQRSTMLFEAGRNYRYALDLAPGLIGEKFLTAVRDGLAIPIERYLAERARLDALRAAFLGGTGEADAYLWPAAPATAPEGLAWTGDPRFISPWTLIGGPIVTVTVAAGANGLPLGCIVAGAPGTDGRMCHDARTIAAVVERQV